MTLKVKPCPPTAKVFNSINTWSPFDRFKWITIRKISQSIEWITIQQTNPWMSHHSKNKQPTLEMNHHSTNQSINPRMKSPFNKSILESTNQSINQSILEWITIQKINQFLNESPFNRSISQSRWQPGGITDHCSWLHPIVVKPIWNPGLQISMSEAWETMSTMLRSKFSQPNFSHSVSTNSKSHFCLCSLTPYIDLYIDCYSNPFHSLHIENFPFNSTDFSNKSLDFHYKILFFLCLLMKLCHLLTFLTWSLRLISKHGH